MYKAWELRRMARLLRYGRLTLESVEWLHRRGYDLVINDGKVTAIVEREDV